MPESSSRVKGQLVLAGEIIEAGASKEVAVCGVGVGVRAGKMRECDPDDRSVTADAMDLLHRANCVVKMLDHVVGQHFSEMIIGKWPGEKIQVVHKIRVRVWRQVQINGAADVFPSAAQIESFEISERRRRWSSCR